MLCGICYKTPYNFAMNGNLHGWWCREGEQAQPVRIGDTDIMLPHIVEDLLFAFTPKRATRPGEKNRTVDFLSVQEVCRQLITALPITQARFDPWNTAQMVQGLQATGEDVSDISFSQPEQFKRARLVKRLLYSNLLTLLPNEKRDREWRHLQRRGERIDHPAGIGEGKDYFDAEAIAIYLAAVWKCGSVEIF